MTKHAGVECARCKERLFSLYVHDFHYCKCNGTFIDGGTVYVRYGWEPDVGKPKMITRGPKDMSPMEMPVVKVGKVVKSRRKKS